MITCKNLSKSYGDLNVLDDINLTISDGDIFGIIGKSGAGKSTLLRCINGLEKINHGEILIDDINIQSLSKKQLIHFRSNIGMIFQHFLLMERMTVYENIAFPMKCRKIPKAQIQSRVDELLKLVDLTDKKYSYPHELSGGQQQRVAIARALALNPKILLCDEATSALDPITCNAILDLLKMVNTQMGVTIVIVTHQVSVIKKICRNMALLNNGNVVYHGAVDDAFVYSKELLDNFLGESLSVELPQHGVNIEIINKNKAQSTIISELSILIQKPISLTSVKQDKFMALNYEFYIINVPNDDLDTVLQFLNDKMANWRII